LSLRNRTVSVDEIDFAGAELSPTVLFANTVARPMLSVIVGIPLRHRNDALRHCFRIARVDFSMPTCLPGLSTLA
jgi:hypothetical protein